MARGRVYSDEEKAAALAALKANGGNVARTARELDIPRKTLEVWGVANGFARQSPGGETQLPPKPEVIPTAVRVEAILPDVEARVTSVIWENVLGLLHIVKEKMKDLTADQAMKTAAIGIDKARLLSGGSTSNVEHHHVRVDRLRELPLAGRLGQLREETAPSGVSRAPEVT